MANINANFNKLPGSYLFSEIARRVAAYSEANPDRTLIRLGIGDVTRPLPAAVTAAMHKAVDEMATAQGFHGYGPEQGYDFLRQAIAEHAYQAGGVDLKPDEIFVSAGAKTARRNIGDIFGIDNIVEVFAPVYRVDADTTALAGRGGEYASAPCRRCNLA